MLYILLRWLFKITGGVYFRSVTILNKEHLPQKGPLLIVANHPSTFMDPIVIATLFDHTFFFLAKGVLFKSRFAKWLLPKFNMIPVYRKQDDPGEMAKNFETFDTCFEHLEKKGVILIFPEGVSLTERKLGPIKTGAARIALGAEARNNFQLGVQIVPIGLNYKNPHKFNRDLVIHVAPPIQVADYKNAYRENPVNAVQQLTVDIKEKLEASVIVIEDENVDALVKEIDFIYGFKLSNERGISPDDKAATFDITRNMVAVVHYYTKADPERVITMASRIRAYLNAIRKLGVRDADIGGYEKTESLMGGGFRALLLIILGFPFFVYGLINNYFPFKIPGWIAKAATDQIQFRGAIMMVWGMFIFLLFYSVQIAFVFHYSHNILTLFLYAVSLPLTGLFCYWYYYSVGKLRSKWLLMVTFYNKRTLISKLIVERESIIAALDKAKDEYRLYQSMHEKQ